VLCGVPSSALERSLLRGAALALAAYLAMVWWAETSTLAMDEAARNAVLLARHPLLTALMADVSRLGAAEGLIALIAVGSLSLWRRDRCWALVLPPLMAGTGALQFLAKWAVDRPRPDLQPWGFPSGHVLSLVVFFGFLAYLGWTSGTSSRRRRAIALLCASPVLVVAYSRLYLDRHWLTDLAGGFAVGLAYLLLVLLIVEVARGRSARRQAVALIP
jgi:membrane-associated phospholipid phosphatase